MSGQDDDTDKSFDPTPKKLLDARKKGEIAKSVDLQTAAGYAGLIIACLVTGEQMIEGLGSHLMAMLDRAPEISDTLFDGIGATAMGAILYNTGFSLIPIFLLPALAIILAIMAQNALVFAPEKLKPKLSRISLISNAKNKFGRSGFFEFGKSFVKLLIFSACLAAFLNARMPEMINAIHAEPRGIAQALGSFAISFLFIVVLVSAMIGGVDALWQHTEHIRKHRMSRKEITDETKEAEGDPHMKQERRQRAQTIAMSQMMGDVPDADVIIVNPTHYAIALKWSRMPGAAPTCVAKGIDDVAHRIREVATKASVPIHSDPPTARALHATVDIGDEISADHYQAVAAAIRFAEAMRKKAKQQVYR